jgi:hypothetical protein
MNYELFKEVVTEKFMEYLSDQYQDRKLDIHPVEKVNVTLDGISLMGEGDVKVVPTIYINDMYEQYQKNNDLQEVLQGAASKMENLLKKVPELVPAVDYNAAKDNIVFQLVNTEQNKEMLGDTPNRAFQDLSIIYRWVIKIEEEGIQSAVIHNTLAKNLGLSEEQLFKLAVENTKRILPPTIRTITDVIAESQNLPVEILDEIIGELTGEQTMWVISNDRGINGAISMLYEDQLHDLAEKVGTDLYIMPSSLHEVIAVSSDMGDPNELAQMVTEINFEEVELSERLSNQVYHYDKDLRKLSLATDTPNKRLDGKIWEAGLIYNTEHPLR